MMGVYWRLMDIKEVLKQMNISQSELARRCGIHKMTLSRILNRKYSMVPYVYCMLVARETHGLITPADIMSEYDKELFNKGKQSVDQVSG
jgi:transcriptional regulator with XRE-family HTH domain